MTNLGKFLGGGMIVAEGPPPTPERPKGAYKERRIAARTSIIQSLLGQAVLPLELGQILGGLVFLLTFLSPIKIQQKVG